MAKKLNRKYVYFFGGSKADGNAAQKNLLGGKGANLAEMVNIGLPVPAGFTITTEVCTYFYDNKKKYPAELSNQVKASLTKIEKEMKAKFGDPKNPLACISSKRCPSFDARYDGHNPKSGSK